MEQTMVRMPKGLKDFLTAYAKGMGISVNALLIMLTWDWKRNLNRKELLKIIPNEELTEMEIEMYAEVKGATK